MSNLKRRARTCDGFQTFDKRTLDSTGAFLVGELERLDQTINEPLVNITYTRDIQLREDVTIADEVSSFTVSNFAATGGVNPNGKNFIAKNSNAISGAAVDIQKTAQNLHLWAMELGYTIPELESAARVGRPVDAQKYEVIKLKMQMDTDEMVYVGDAGLGVKGLINNDSVITPANVTGGSFASNLSAPDTIVAQINKLLSDCWQKTGYSICPAELRLPPAQFAQLVSQKVSSAGNVSLLQYIKDNSLSLSINGKALNIQPLKWLVGAGAASADRMIAYTNDKSRVRFPMVPLQRTPLEYRGLYQLTTYFGRLGQVEFVYPETISYADGI